MSLSLLTTRYNSGLGCVVFSLVERSRPWNRASLLWRKVAVVSGNFLKNILASPSDTIRQFCFTVSYSTHPSPMFSMFMKLKQDPQLLGPGHVVLHSWSRISKSFISRPHQVPHIGGGASAPEGRVEKPLPMPSCYSTNSNIETWHTITKKITTWNQDCYYEHLLTLQLHWQNEE